MPLAEELIRKYNVAAPRYTSYPTVPLWNNNLGHETWEGLVKKAFAAYGRSEGISVYLHLPFCESLCTYCGCNKRITKNHSVEKPYINAIVKEWEKYRSLFDGKPKLAGIHLGGGTPTFFSPESLFRILDPIITSSSILPNAEFSFEGHPNNTLPAHLKTLADLGFDRVSYGIQDFDPLVQQAIHRIQPFENVRSVTENSRAQGFRSINFDLIYGLPHQTEETLRQTFSQVISLSPDRIAFYSYAHVPSAFPAQRSYGTYLPDEILKRELYNYGKGLLLEAGYQEVGMDHFALAGDPLCIAKNNGNLHRNFMGYTTSPSKILIGLGASSISDIYIAYAQNEKEISGYQNQLSNTGWAISKGHIHSREDLLVKELILDLICRQEATIPLEIWESLPESSLTELAEMRQDGLLELQDYRIRITQKGMALIRNICSKFDLRLADKKSVLHRFSQTI